jgi:exopolysaccharide production protein ExoZ
MRQRLESLQVVRFVAASLVIVHHGWQALISDPDPAPLATIGPMGVDIFFVLSGYIMAVSAHDARPAEFLYRRVTRIVPLYYLLTLAFMGVLAFAGTLTAAPLATSFLFVPLPGVRPYLNVAWTLDFEMLFYAGFALVLWLRRPGLVAVLAAFCACLLARQVVGGAALSFVGNPLILEFLAGVLVAQIPFGPRRAFGALIAALVLFALLSGLSPIEDGWRRPLLMTLPAALLIYGAANMTGGGRLWRGLVYLGDASYAAYLVHQFPLSILAPLRGLIPEPLGLLVAVSLCWALAALVREAVERPLLRFLRTPPARPQRRWLPVRP